MSRASSEEDWLAGQEPAVLLQTATGRGRSRRLRLCAVACCRRVAHLLPDERCRRAIDVAEAYADRRATRQQLIRAYEENAEARASRDEINTCGRAARVYAAGAVRYAANAVLLTFAFPSLVQAAFAGAFGMLPPDDTSPSLVAGTQHHPLLVAEQQRQCALVREVLRNPFRSRPAIPASLPASVLSVARAAYDERLPSFDLDPVRLSVLADALEDAGCSEAVLSHLRDPAPHVRGCWALDLVLGKP